MPNHKDWERLDLQAQEIVRLQRELDAAHSELRAVRRDCEQMLYESGHRLGLANKERAEAIAGNAKLVHALDCAIIWAEALFAWLPDGTVMPDGIKAAREGLTRALQELRR